MEYYDEKAYFKAAPLFEELITVYKGTRDVEKMYYYYAYCQYGQEDYILAAYYFKNFVNTYPKSQYAEDAQYMYAFCYYLQSPGKNLDQTYTYKAIDAFQLFTNKFPESDKINQCNEYIDKLRYKLQEKESENAKLYYKLGYYKAAQIAFKNLLLDYPDLSNTEEINFLKLKSCYLLAENSIASKKETRYNSAIDTYKRFTDKYQESTYAKEAEDIYLSAVKNLKKIKNDGR